MYCMDFTSPSNQREIHSVTLSLRVAQQPLQFLCSVDYGWQYHTQRAVVYLVAIS